VYKIIKLDFRSRSSINKIRLRHPSVLKNPTPPKDLQLIATPTPQTCYKVGMPVRPALLQQCTFASIY